MPNTEDRETKKIQPNELTSEQKTSIKTRTLVAIPLVATFLVALIFGGWVMMAFIALLAGFGIYEIIKSAKKKFQPWVWVLTYIFGYVLIFWPLIDNNVQNAMAAKEAGTTFVFQLEDSFAQLNVPITIIGLCLMIYFLTGILDEKLNFKDIAHLFAFTFLVALGLQAMLVCRFFPFVAYGVYSSIDTNAYGFKWAWSAGLLFVVYAVCSLTDVFAYFGGMLFGKHKMNPRISPKKTWEGFFIGWAFGAAIGMGIMFLMAGLNYPVIPALDMDHWWGIVILGILMPLIGTLGDLAFSLIKRSEEIKDFSNLLPGHGGILDRFDSPIFASLGTAIIISFFVQGWVL